MVLLISTALAASPPSILEPLRVGRASPDAAVVVANEDYAYLPDVPYASRDADAFYTTLVYTRGLPADRVRDLRGANREQLLAAVREASAEVDTGGVLWVYFAGHGAASAQDGSLMLVGDDAKAELAVFDRRSVTLADIRQEAGAVPVSLVLDTCFTGTGRGGQDLVPGTRFAVPAQRPAADATVWTAAAPDQVAGAYEPARHGRFTYFLVGAMRGWADGELDGQRDGAITVGEASAYVRRALKTLQIVDQQPVLDGTPDDRVLALGSEQGPDLASLPRTASFTTAPTGAVGGRVAPIRHVAGAVYEDAARSPVAWVEVRELARRDAAGRHAIQKRQLAVVSQVVVTAAAAEFLLAGPITWGLGGADCKQTGDCTLRDMGIGMTVVGGGLLAWDIALTRRVKHHRAAALDAANSVLDGQR